MYFYRTRVRSLAMLVSDSLTHSLTDSCLVNLIDVTLACEDFNSKLGEVVTLADVSDEDRVGNSCCRFGSWGLVIKLNFCSDFEHKVWSSFWSWSSGKIFMVKSFLRWKKNWLSCQHWLLSSLTDSLTLSLISQQFVTRCWCLVEIFKIVLGRD